MAVVVAPGPPAPRPPGPQPSPGYMAGSHSGRIHQHVSRERGPPPPPPASRAQCRAPLSADTLPPLRLNSAIPSACVGERRLSALTPGTCEGRKHKKRKRGKNIYIFCAAVSFITTGAPATDAGRRTALMRRRASRVKIQFRGFIFLRDHSVEAGKYREPLSKHTGTQTTNKQTRKLG